MTAALTGAGPQTGHLLLGDGGAFGVKLRATLALELLPGGQAQRVLPLAAGAAKTVQELADACPDVVARAILDPALLPPSAALTAPLLLLRCEADSDDAALDRMEAQTERLRRDGWIDTAIDVPPVAEALALAAWNPLDADSRRRLAVPLTLPRHRAVAGLEVIDAAIADCRDAAAEAGIALGRRLWWPANDRLAADLVLVWQGDVPPHLAAAVSNDDDAEQRRRDGRALALRAELADRIRTAGFDTAGSRAPSDDALLLKAVKASIDPQHRINPGALGFG